MPEILMLDTGIVSIFLKTSEAEKRKLAEIEKEIKGNIGVISFITVAEMLFWAEKNSWGEKKRQDLDKRLRAYGILDPTRITAEIWAKTRLTCDRMGKSKNRPDLWIAAAAVEHDIRLLTMDGDFDGIPNLHVTKFCR
jgi:predicted nucleic acid-binding protein